MMLNDSDSFELTPNGKLSSRVQDHSGGRRAEARGLKIKGGTEIG